MPARARPIPAREQRFANATLVAALAILGLFGALYLNAIPLGTLNVYIKHLSLNFLCAPALAVIVNVQIKSRHPAHLPFIFRPNEFIRIFDT